LKKQKYKPLKTKYMKINGIIIVMPLMSEMKVGQKGYLTTEAVLIVNTTKIFISTRYDISEIRDGKYLIPITRTGEGKEDYEIDFSVTTTFYNTQFSEKDFKSVKENSNYIGPYDIQTEIDQPLNYREQKYPRMDLLELVGEFLTIKETLRDTPNETIALEDQKIIRRLLKEKMKELMLSELKKYETSFDILNEEESKNGEIFNYIEDVSMANFIHNRIETLKLEQNPEDMSVQELEVLQKQAIKKEDYEKGRYYQNLIDIKTGVTN